MSHITTLAHKKYPAPNLGRDDWRSFARAWARKGQGLGKKNPGWLGRGKEILGIQFPLESIILKYHHIPQVHNPPDHKLIQLVLLSDEF